MGVICGFIKQTGIEARLWTLILEMFGSDLDRNTAYPEGLLWFSSAPPGKGHGNISIRI
jgi:hypothetical protein